MYIYIIYIDNKKMLEFALNGPLNFREAVVFHT